MAIVIMERHFEEAPSDEEIASMKEVTITCLAVNDVTLEQVYASKDRHRFICVFEAGDTAAVVRSIDSTGIPYERVWAADTMV
jgi:hypothetical protein